MYVMLFLLVCPGYARWDGPRSGTSTRHARVSCLELPDWEATRLGIEILMAPAAASSLKGSTKKSTTTKKTTHMTYEDMIKEAILAHGAEARLGLGRPTIKKYILAKHPDTGRLPLASFNTRFNQAITRGEEKGVFLLPKGVSGKVKVSAKAKPAAKPAAKKASKPAATTTAKKVTKPATKKPAAKKVTKAPVKKTSSAKATTAAKKSTAVKKSASKAAATKKAPAKKTAAKKAATTKKTSTKKAPAKKAPVKKATSKSKK
ncbi:hypothetical protein MEQU1_002149 [Malassezia equina]|uniref:Histone H1 n=1 Tax=Malassezia equina TaxID=1381935 RepID=A0AAF0EDC9_9BASI|nr:hypothetical protein MEQU1_002149 [Malassezia equina]